MLVSAGWSIRDETRYGSMEILLYAEVDVASLRVDFRRLLEGLQRGISQVRIE